MIEYLGNADVVELVDSVDLGAVTSIKMFELGKEAIMEKVVILGSIDKFGDFQAEKVNKYLDEGWTVKNIHTAVTGDGITAIFVLEKK